MQASPKDLSASTYSTTNKAEVGPQYSDPAASLQQILIDAAESEPAHSAMGHPITLQITPNSDASRQSGRSALTQFYAASLLAASKIAC